MELNTSSGNENRLTGRARAIVHAAWWLVTILSVSVFVVSIPRYYQDLNRICFRLPCLAMSLSMSRALSLELGGIHFSNYVRFVLAIQILLFIINLSIGIFLFAKKSDDWLAIMVSMMLITSLQADLFRAFDTTEQLFLNLSMIIGIIYTTLIILIFYIFPTGRFYPRWTALLAGVSVLVTLILPLKLNPGTLAVEWSNTRTIGWFLSLILVNLAILIYRYEKIFNGNERRQARWIVSGLIYTLVGSIVFILLKQTVSLIEQNAFLYALINVATLFWSMILPLSIVLAILRSQIWDIDLIVRRTISYTVLTGILLAFYFGSVVIFKTVLESLTGVQSLAISVIITLILAVLFSPLRQGVQNNIDRIFYRQKYDKEKALEIFRQASRSEVDLDKLSGRMMSVIEDTVQPEFVSLWLIKSSTPGQTGMFAPLNMDASISSHRQSEHEDAEAT